METKDTLKRLIEKFEAFADLADKRAEAQTSARKWHAAEKSETEARTWRDAVIFLKGAASLPAAPVAKPVPPGFCQNCGERYRLT